LCLCLSYCIFNMRFRLFQSDLNVHHNIKVSVVLNEYIIVAWGSISCAKRLAHLVPCPFSWQPVYCRIEIPLVHAIFSDP
jgi:hypothetical protein